MRGERQDEVRQCSPAHALLNSFVLKGYKTNISVPDIPGYKDMPGYKEDIRYTRI